MTLHPLAVTDAERPFLDALVASGDPLGDMAKWMHELDRMGYSLNQARGAMGWLAGLANGMTSGGSGTRSAYRRMFAELQRRSTPRRTRTVPARTRPLGCPAVARDTLRGCSTSSAGGTG